MDTRTPEAICDAVESGAMPVDAVIDGIADSPTPLVFAIRAGCLHAVTRLLKLNANPSLTDPLTKRRPMHEAVLQRNDNALAICKLLPVEDLTMSAEWDWDNSPLEWYLWQKVDEIAEIRRNWWQCWVPTEQQIQQAVDGMPFAILTWMVQTGPVQPVYDTLGAVVYCKRSTTKAIIRSERALDMLKAAVAGWSYSQVLTAFTSKEEPLVLSLVDAGFPPNFSMCPCDTLLHAAVQRNFEETTRRLLAKHADATHGDNRNVLPVAAKNGNKALMKLLRDAGARFDANKCLVEAVDGLRTCLADEVPKFAAATKWLLKQPHLDLDTVLESDETVVHTIMKTMQESIHAGPDKIELVDWIDATAKERRRRWSPLRAAWIQSVAVGFAAASKPKAKPKPKRRAVFQTVKPRRTKIKL